MASILSRLQYINDNTACVSSSLVFNRLMRSLPRQNGRHFVDDIFRCIFFNENVWFPIQISLKFVPKGPINNIPALVQMMAWCRPGDKPLSEPVMAKFLTHICVTRPQTVYSCCLPVTYIQLCHWPTTQCQLLLLMYMICFNTKMTLYT